MDWEHNYFEISLCITVHKAEETKTSGRSAKKLIWKDNIQTQPQKRIQFDYALTNKPALSMIKM